MQKQIIEEKNKVYVDETNNKLFYKLTDLSKYLSINPSIISVSLLNAKKINNTRIELNGKIICLLRDSNIFNNNFKGVVTEYKNLYTSKTIPVMNLNNRKEIFYSIRQASKYYNIPCTEVVRIIKQKCIKKDKDIPLIVITAKTLNMINNNATEQEIIDESTRIYEELNRVNKRNQTFDINTKEIEKTNKYNTSGKYTSKIEAISDIIGIDISTNNDILFKEGNMVYSIQKYKHV